MVTEFSLDICTWVLIEMNNFLDIIVLELHEAIKVARKHKKVILIGGRLKNYEYVFSN